VYFDRTAALPLSPAACLDLAQKAAAGIGRVSKAYNRENLVTPSTRVSLLKPLSTVISNQTLFTGM
jgi:hypothetical protein